MVVSWVQAMGSDGVSMVGMGNVAALVQRMEICCVLVEGMETVAVLVVVQDCEPFEFLGTVSDIVSQIVFPCMERVILVGHS